MGKSGQKWGVMGNSGKSGEKWQKVRKIGKTWEKVGKKWAKEAKSYYGFIRYKLCLSPLQELAGG